MCEPAIHVLKSVFRRLIRQNAKLLWFSQCCHIDKRLLLCEPAIFFLRIHHRIHHHLKTTDQMMMDMASSTILNSRIIQWKTQFQPETSYSHEECRIIWEFQICWGGISHLKPLRRYLRYFRGTHWQSSLSHRLRAFFTWMNRITECLYGAQCRSCVKGQWLKGLFCGHGRSCPPSSATDDAGHAQWVTAMYRTCSVSHRDVTIWRPIYISRVFFNTVIQCEITRRFPRRVVKVGLHVQCKNISILSRVQPWTSTDLKLSYFNT